MLEVITKCFYTPFFYKQLSFEGLSLKNGQKIKQPF